MTYSLISLDLGMNSGRRMELHMFTLYREPEWQTQCRMALSLFWHPEQWFPQGALAGRAVWDTTHHCFPQDSSCIRAYASPSCSLRNLGGKTENIFLRAVLQPGQIQLTPFFLIFVFPMCVILSCVDPTCVQSFHSQPSVTSLRGHKCRAGVPLHVSVL